MPPQEAHLRYVASPSLSGELLRQSLSEFTRTQICHVSLVVVLFGFNSHDYEEDEEIPIREGKLCYAAVTRSEVILLDRQHLQGLSLSPVAPSYDDLYRASPDRPQPMACSIPFTVIDTLCIDPDREDHFELLMREDRKRGFPACFILSSVHRKAFCEALRALFDTYFIEAAIRDDAISADGKPDASRPDRPASRDPDRVRFSVVSTGSVHSSSHIRTLGIDFDEHEEMAPPSWQHPAEQFFDALPEKYQGKIFHRAGYMFCAPDTDPASVPEGELGEWVDPANGMFGNRATGTFRYQTPYDEGRGLTLHQRKFLQVAVCPEKAISPCSSILRGRDLRGHNPGRAVGKNTLHELLHGRDDCDDADFHLWAESVGRAVAMNECRLYDHIDYCEPQRLVHLKKMNPVGDKASWVAFKMHMVTPTREIGLIACRRKCIPPYFDTFQDIVFLLYGPCASGPAPGALLPPPLTVGFMSELELMVDTLSPTVVPLPWHYAHGPHLHLNHPTYADQLVLQARMNALLNNLMLYQWLSTRAWLSSVPGEAPGLFPTTEFLGSACWKLARGFANAILVRVSHREERLQWAERMGVVVEGIGAEAAVLLQHTVQNGTGGSHPEEGKMDTEIKDTGSEDGSQIDARRSRVNGQFSSVDRQLAVDDPMDIVERMCTEFVVAQQSLRVHLPNITRTTYTAEEEWRGRVSQYLVYCIDDGVFPGALNVKRLLNVITGNMIRAPLISYETAAKLERVVDFLLYLKRRCGRALDLPTYWSPEKQEEALAANTFAAQLRPGTQKHTDHVSQYASLASSAPAARSLEGKTHLYDYDPSLTLLQKFRDPTLMTNFTCNEHLMVLLLDTNYIEYLENSALNTSEHSDASVLPQVLTALLMKDYNVALVRAVCNKIILNQIQYDGFIPALIALSRDGSVHAAIYSLRALTFLARTFPLVIYEYGGVAIGMWHIYMSRNEDLLDAALDMTLELVTNQTIHLFGQTAFIRKLVDLLKPRVGQQLRYRSGLLQKACSLILKFSQVPSLLSLCLANHCHKELIDILKRGAAAYQPILLHVTACMGQLYVNAGSQILGVPSETAQHDAIVLVHSLAGFCSREHLRLCLNLLIILQYLLRLPKGYYSRLTPTRYNKLGGLVHTPPDPAFEKRTLILQHLVEEENLESILDELVKTASGEEERTETALELSGAIQVIDGRKQVTVGEGAAGPKEDWLLGRRMVAKNCKEKARWFRARINFAKDAKSWNVVAIWQTDKNKQFLAIPKA